MVDNKICKRYFVDEYFLPTIRTNKIRWTGKLYVRNKVHMFPELFYSYPQGLTLRRDKTDFSSFPESTRFHRVQLNLMQELKLNIYNPKKKHLCAYDGYNFQGKWGFLLQMPNGTWVDYPNVFWWESGLFNATKLTYIATTPNGFVLQHVRGTINTPNVLECDVQQAEFDFINSKLIITLSETTKHSYPIRVYFLLDHHQSCVSDTLPQIHQSTNSIVQCLNTVIPRPSTEPHIHTNDLHSDKLSFTQNHACDTLTNISVKEQLYIGASKLF